MVSKVAFWVPLQPETGLGHYYRNIGLYKRIQNAVFFANTTSIAIEENILIINSSDPLEIHKFLVKNGVSSLLIDNYFLEDLILDYFSKITDMRVVYFDKDFNDNRFKTLLNSNPYAKLTNYKNINSDVCYFLGPSYYAFKDDLTKYQQIEKVSNRIFVCFGGSDIKKISYGILKYLKHDKEYIVSLGKGCSYEYYKKVKYCFKDLKLAGKVFYDPSNYFELLSSCEAAILSASTICYDAISLGVKILCIQVADNQDKLAAWLKESEVSFLREEELTHNQDFEYRKIESVFLFDGKNLINYLEK